MIFMQFLKAWPCLVFVFLVGVTVTVTVQASSNIHQMPLSPVSNLEASLTASAAHGTIVAIRAHYTCDDNYNDNDNGENSENDENGENDENKYPCVLMLSKSDTANAHRSNANNDYYYNVSDVKLDINAPGLPEGPVQYLFTNTDTDTDTDTDIGVNIDSKSSTSPMFYILFHPNRIHSNHGHGLYAHANAHNPVVMGITGFAPDAHHMVHHAAQSISHYTYIYSTPSCDTHNFVQRQIISPLAQKLRSAAMSENGRPFGLQMLIPNKHPTFTTLDPSGNVHDWHSMTTAIGKGAPFIRRQLVRYIQEYCSDNTNQRGKEINHLDLDLETAMEIALKAILSSQDQEEINALSSYSDKTKTQQGNRNQNQNQSDDDNNNDDVHSILAQINGLIVLLGPSQNKCIALDPKLLYKVYQTSVLTSTKSTM